MPMNGGKWVTVLNTGTNSSPATPMKNTSLRSPGVVGSFSSLLMSGRLTSPFMVTDIMPSGTTRHASEGTMRLVIITSEVS